MGRYSVTIVLRVDKLLDKTQPISPLDVNILHRQHKFVEFCPHGFVQTQSEKMLFPSRSVVSHPVVKVCLLVFEFDYLFCN